MTAITARMSEPLKTYLRGMVVTGAIAGLTYAIEPARIQQLGLPAVGATIIVYVVKAVIYKLIDK